METFAEGQSRPLSTMEFLSFGEMDKLGSCFTIGRIEKLSLFTQFKRKQAKLPEKI